MADMSPFQDDTTTPPAPTGSADPLAVFRHDRLPPWALIHRRIDRTEIDDIDAAVADAIGAVAGLLPSSGRACIALGSRGIDRIAEVARATVDVLRARGLDVFAIPAMGSHGAATADGQLAVLASLGITPQSIGCEIRSSMDTVQIGRASCRERVFGYV